MTDITNAFRYQAMLEQHARTTPDEPIVYLCPVGCGCTWRDNRDGSMSLFGPNSRSCDVCERTPLAEMRPLYGVPR